jgi:hypothetical protein
MSVFTRRFHRPLPLPKWPSAIFWKAASAGTSIRDASGSAVSGDPAPGSTPVIREDRSHLLVMRAPATSSPETSFACSQ